MQLGHALRRRRESAPQSSAIEGAVFALFGLLLAFTFAGCGDPLRRASRIGDAGEQRYWNRLPASRPASSPRISLRCASFSATTSARDSIFTIGFRPRSRRPPSSCSKRSGRNRSPPRRAPGASPDAAKLLLPALNEMIDITSTRQNAFHMHPPAIIFLLLFVLSGCCAFVAGYGMTATARSWFYSIAFAVTVTLTVYATLEIEYPRQGLIRLTQMDDTFLQLRDSIQQMRNRQTCGWNLPARDTTGVAWI